MILRLTMCERYTYTYLLLIHKQLHFMSTEVFEHICSCHIIMLLKVMIDYIRLSNAHYKSNINKKYNYHNYFFLEGRRRDGFTYVLYLNGGHPPWSLLDYAGHCLQATFYGIITLQPVRRWLNLPVFLTRSLLRKVNRY